MSMFRSSTRSRRPIHLTRPRQRPGATIEGLEGRVLLTFNAYIAGLGGGTINTDYSFTFTTTGQAAKHWDINWGDGNTQSVDAPDQVNGWTSPYTTTHRYDTPFDYAVTGTATSTTNVTAAAVLQENSAFGNGGSTGKTVQGLNDTNSVGTNIASVVDNDNNTYVLSIDGKRMAVTRFKPDGTLDTGASWKSTGTYVLNPITLSTVQDTPKAMAIDLDNNYLYVVGTSNSMWAAARININFINTTPEGWHWHDFTGTANAVWLDWSDAGDKIGVAGTTSSGNMQVAVLYATDQPGITGGTLDTDFANGIGYVTVPSSIYGITGTSPNVSASASAIFEGDDVPGGFGGVEGEWFVSGTVSYSCAGGGGTTSGSDMVVIDYLWDGSTRSGWGNGSGAALFNTCNASLPVGGSFDSNYAMVESVVSSTQYVTLVGAASGTVLTERFLRSNGQRDTTNPVRHAVRARA